MCGALSLLSIFTPRLMEKLSMLTTCTDAALCCVASSNRSTWRSHLPWINYAHNHMTSATTLLSLFASPVGHQPALFPDALCFLFTGYLTPSFPVEGSWSINGVRGAGLGWERYGLVAPTWANITTLYNLKTPYILMSLLQWEIWCCLMIKTKTLETGLVHKHLQI